MFSKFLFSSNILFRRETGEKDKKGCAKVKNHGAGPNLLAQLNKISIISNFLIFFQIFLSIFPSWIRIHSPDKCARCSVNVFSSCLGDYVCVRFCDASHVLGPPETLDQVNNITVLHN